MQRLPGLRDDLLGFHAEPKYSSNNPARSRIRVVRDPLRDMYVPVYAGDYTPGPNARAGTNIPLTARNTTSAPFAGPPVPPGRFSRSPIPACRSNATCARAKTSLCASSGAWWTPWCWRSGKKRSKRKRPWKRWNGPGVSYREIRHAKDPRDLGPMAVSKKGPQVNCPAAKKAGYQRESKRPMQVAGYLTRNSRPWKR
jgi:hypothetical protein